MSLGHLLKLVRTHKKIKQKEMAEFLNISQNYLSLIESEKKQPSVELISEMAKNLEISNEALLFAASDVPIELGSEERKDFHRLQNNIISLILFEVTGEMEKIG